MRDGWISNDGVDGINAAVDCSSGIDSSRVSVDGTRRVDEANGGANADRDANGLFANGFGNAAAEAKGFDKAAAEANGFDKAL
jgi:hypothetical protein